ncbi:tRNA lysidine(34) synthetase TilS [Acetobacter sp. AN02]|uniref:tRNA lysidine(34) synthetase TilS n=1 Tax=Acetobacter sp. AN02 TaxID=2894186 RepID=UPI00243421EC|nr:tRNA lysidine(34) synthetase TilS [Acetobacter sp. AN02]MDG6095365.1 tRNA lysidine(34) synthetase TilS [Acetobacter sp. AN02]
MALAVSGGGDSMALAWLASRWRRNLLALIVDHGLRPESAEEARLTARRLGELNIPSRILTLSGLLPGPGIAARARRARYEALFRACREAGATSLLLGHQADDQAETVVIRQETHSGPDGLAAMAVVSWGADVRLVRPLLGESRAGLRDLLRAAGVSWEDDPSNENRAAARVRIRQDICGTDRRDGLLRLAREAGAVRQDHAAGLAEELACIATFYAEGWVRLERLPSPPAMAALIRTLGGHVYPPPREAVDRLLASAGPASAGRGATLAGLCLRCFPAGLFLFREVAAMAGACPARNGALWDGRFVLRTQTPCPPGLEIRAAGTGLARRERCGLPALLCATLPALWSGACRVAVPHLDLRTDEALRDVRFVFRPAIPATGTALWDLSER